MKISVLRLPLFKSYKYSEKDEAYMSYEFRTELYEKTEKIRGRPMLGGEMSSDNMSWLDDSISDNKEALRLLSE